MVNTIDQSLIKIVVLTSAMASSSKQIPQNPASDDNLPWIPEGYTRVEGPDNQIYVVPDFMVPGLHHAFDGYRIKKDLDVSKAPGSVSHLDDFLPGLHPARADG
jgi:hypothetical protein